MRILLTVLLAVTGIASADAGQGTRHTITIDGAQFTPAELTVHRGDRIVWVNKDPFPHTVTADNKAFDSGSIAANASWNYIATKKGDYAYICTFHPTMKGKIKVQ